MIHTSLQETLLPDFRCGNCGRIGARQQTVSQGLPTFLIVHANKPGVAACLSATRNVRLSGRDLHRFAAVHHTRGTTKFGHYTTTVATHTNAFHCHGHNLAEEQHLFTDALSKAFLIVYQNNDADVLHQCGGSHPTPSSVVVHADEESEHLFGDNANTEH